MSVFQSKKAIEPQPRMASEKALSGKRPVQHSIIGPDLTISGDLVSTGDIKIDGRVDGNITCRTLTLGDQPVINSAISAETVKICGTFSGEVKANKVVLTSTAKVKGDISQEVLEIEPGAFVEGQVTRLGGLDAESAA